MQDLIALLAFVAGVPMIVIGYIWVLVVSKQVSSGWLLANLFVIPILGFIMMHWHKVKVPFLILFTGIVLVFITIELVPQG
jgi:hypothetical protein